MGDPVTRLNEDELARGVADAASWHADFANTSWVYVGGLDHQLTEGDVICVFSQFGEVEDLELARDAETGRSKGFAFIKFEDHRSAILTVDNFNGAQLLGRNLRVDHHRAKLKRAGKKEEAKSTAERLSEVQPGGKYAQRELEGEHSLERGVNVFGGRGGGAHDWRANVVAAESVAASAEGGGIQQKKKKSKSKSTSLDKKAKRARVDRLEEGKTRAKDKKKKKEGKKKHRGESDKRDKEDAAPPPPLNEGAWKASSS